MTIYIGIYLRNIPNNAEIKIKYHKLELVQIVPQTGILKVPQSGIKKVPQTGINKKVPQTGVFPYYILAPSIIKPIILDYS